MPIIAKMLLFPVFIQYGSQHINLFRTKLRRNDIQGCMRTELMHKMFNTVTDG